MDIAVWVFFMIGDPTPEEPGTPYVQATASPFKHARDPQDVERRCAEEYEDKYPGHPVCECGWRQQTVRVMGQ